MEMIALNKANRANKKITTAYKKDSQLRYTTLKNMFGVNLIGFFPLNDFEALTIADYGGNERNGVWIGTPSHKISPFGGMCAPLFDGLQTFGANLYTSGLSNAFNGEEGALFFDACMDSESTWVDSLNHYAFRIRADLNNDIYIRKGDANSLSMIYKAGGVTTTLGYPVSSTPAYMHKRDKPFHVLLTWSKTLGKIELYIDNILVDSGVNIGTFAGLPVDMVVGCATQLVAVDWKGYIANFGIVDRYISKWEAQREFMTVTYDIKIISVLGDSISNDANDWPHQLIPLYNDGYVFMRTHAVAGDSIVANMATQVTEAKNDNADIIIMQLGTNDIDATDAMEIQTIVESQIERLQLGNDRATLYYLLPLPRWTDITGEILVDLTLVRGAIISACIAKDVTYWDTYTDPWIVASDTSDGVHPTLDGGIKVAKRVTALLP